MTAAPISLRGRAAAGAIDAWLLAAASIAAAQIIATIASPGETWPVPLGIAMLSFLCAARTIVEAPKRSRADRWRWHVAALGFLLWGAQWVANATLNYSLSGDPTLPSLLAAAARAAIVVSLMPLTKVDDGALFRALDVLSGLIFTSLLTLLSWPDLLSGTADLLDKRFMYLGYGAMALLAATALLTEGKRSSRRLIIAMLVTQLGYAATGVVANELHSRGLVTMDMPLLACSDLAFIAYLLLLKHGERADDRQISSVTILSVRLVPILLVTLIVALAFAIQPLSYALAICAGVASLIVHAIRTGLTEDRVLTHQRAVLTAARARANVMANMMHEIRSPLGLISLNAGLIDRGVKVEPLTRVIRQRCSAIREMLDAMLDLERIDARMVTPHPVACDLEALVRNVIGDLMPQAECFGVDLCFEGTTARVQVDPVMLGRVLANLVNNALRFTPEGGRVRVSIEYDVQDVLRILVADTGKGISEHARPHLFARFCPSEPPLHGLRGSGLGLCISRELARSTGADVMLCATGTAGTTFAIVLPQTELLPHSER